MALASSPNMMVSPPTNSRLSVGRFSNRPHTVQSERVLSSNILGETVLGPLPQEENVQYVEIPVVEEVIKHVPRKEYVEVEKRVPKYEYEWVERVVEVPQVHVVDKTVEVPQVQEVIRHVPVKQVVEVPKEIIRRVPKIETKIVEREIEVPGEVIDVPKPYLVENKVVVPRFTDKEVPTVVSQKLVPVISESPTDFVDVDLKEYNPYLVAVDVYVPRPVARQLIAATKTEEHRVVDVPIGQFNALLKQLNSHVTESDFQELLVRDGRGAIPVAPVAAGTALIPPKSAEWESGHAKGALHYTTSTTNLGPVYGGTQQAGGNIQTTTTTTTSTQKGGYTTTSYQPSTTYSQNGTTTTSYQTGAPIYSGQYTTSGGYTSTSVTPGGYTTTTTNYNPQTYSAPLNSGYIQQSYTPKLNGRVPTSATRYSSTQHQ